MSKMCFKIIKKKWNGWMIMMKQDTLKIVEIITDILGSLYYFICLWKPL